MGNNGSVSNYKNVIISASRNHNDKKEYRIMNPIPIKDKNNEGTRVANKNIQCNKESISTSTGRDTTISRSYQTKSNLQKS